MSDPSLLSDPVNMTLDRGLVHYAMGLRDEAISCWNEALEKSPGNVRALDYLQSVGALAPTAPGAASEPSSEPMDDDLGVATLDRAGQSLVSPFGPVLGRSEPSAPADDSSDVVDDVDILVREALEREQAGEFEVALKRCEDALRRAPEHEAALSLRETLRHELNEVYLKELEPLERIPFLRATDASILELSLDPVGGFLISQIDGEISVEELLTILGTFDQFRVLSALHYFLVNEIIELR